MKRRRFLGFVGALPAAGAAAGAAAAIGPAAAPLKAWATGDMLKGRPLPVGLELPEIDWEEAWLSPEVDTVEWNLDDLLVRLPERVAAAMIDRAREDGAEEPALLWIDAREVGMP